jgi:hypothetical protein
MDSLTTFFKKIKLPGNKPILQTKSVDDNNTSTNLLINSFWTNNEGFCKGDSGRIIFDRSSIIGKFSNRTRSTDFECKKGVTTNVTKSYVTIDINGKSVCKINSNVLLIQPK